MCTKTDLPESHVKLTVPVMIAIVWLESWSCATPDSRSIRISQMFGGIESNRKMSQSVCYVQCHSTVEYRYSGVPVCTGTTYNTYVGSTGNLSYERQSLQSVTRTHGSDKKVENDGCLSQSQTSTHAARPATNLAQSTIEQSSRLGASRKTANAFGHREDSAESRWFQPANFPLSGQGTGGVKVPAFERA